MKLQDLASKLEEAVNSSQNDDSSYSKSVVNYKTEGFINEI